MPTSALGSSLADLRRSTIARLRAAGVESPALDANVLIGHVLGVAPEHVALQRDAELRLGSLRSIEAVTARRERREPVAYITGTKAFRRLQISVNRDVLIPRPESELLVEVGLKLWDARPGSVLVDIGTGSGAIALALADERPGRNVVGADCSHAALRVAGDNSRRLQLEQRVVFRHGDGTAAIDLEDAVVVANLPYIPSAALDALEPEVARWEPRVALDGGPDGLWVIREVAAQVGRARARAAAFEIGPGQSDAVAALLREAGFKNAAVHRDLAGHPRVVTGSRVS